MKGFVSADQYSFPSGHACRVVLMACLLPELIPELPGHSLFGLRMWAFWVCLSRVNLGRHYLSDVICGSILSWAIYLLMQKWLFLSAGPCSGLHRFIHSYIPR